MPFEKGNTIGRQFKSGQSGNPAGKPLAIRQVAEAARPMTMKALDTLYTVMTDKDAPAAARVSAAESILSRGWGKPQQTVTLTHDNADMKDLSDAELLAIIAAARSNGGTDPDPEASGPH